RSPASSTSCRAWPSCSPGSSGRPATPSPDSGAADDGVGAAVGGATRSTREVDVDLTWSPQEEAFRAEARTWLEANLAEWRAACGGAPASGYTREGFAQHLEWERRLFEGRWAAVSWPEEHGGRGASLWEWLIFEEEYYRAGAPPRVTQNGIFLLA